MADTNESLAPRRKGETPDGRRDLPGVGSLLESAQVARLFELAPRQTVTNAVRSAINNVRAGTRPAPSTMDAWSTLVSSELNAMTLPSLRRVINATGVVLHTNLGRAPLAGTALRAIQETAAGFSNLEYDLSAGARGSRYTHCVALLRELTGCEDALVVNNCAAALVLAVDTLARDREVIVSRGELVEIGGSFRIPDIMRRGGARLVEVGTTNRTHLADYERAIGSRTGAIVKVHRSNFAISGFTADVSAAELAALARTKNVPLVHDLGSGLLLALEHAGLHGEPTASDAVRAGADVVTLSGDKLLGGPQAGIVLGTAEVIEQLRSTPLARALRVDKLTVAALGATLALYRDRETALRDVPVLAMLSATVARLEARARAVADGLAGHGIRCDVVSSESSVGGGAFPTAILPSFAITLSGDATSLEKRLRASPQPVVARVKDGRLLLDFRSILEGEDDELRSSLVATLA